MDQSNQRPTQRDEVVHREDDDDDTEEDDEPVTVAAQTPSHRHTPLS